MKKILTALLLPLISISCNAQKDGSTLNINETSKSKPKVSYKVNRKYDYNGNLIRYDSSYSWSYSGKNGTLNSDSILRYFSKQFNNGFLFGDWNWPDNSLYNNLSGRDFLIRNWRSGYIDMEKMMQRMDSLNMVFDRSFIKPKEEQPKINSRML